MTTSNLHCSIYLALQNPTHPVSREENKSFTLDKQNTPLRMEYHLEALTHEFSLRKAEPPLFVHELDGNPGSIVGMVELTFEGPTPSAYNLACKRMAISCRTWEMYLQSQSVLNSL